MNIHEIKFTAITLVDFMDYLAKKQLAIIPIQNVTGQEDILNPSELQTLCANFTSDQALKVIYPEKDSPNGHH